MTEFAWDPATYLDLMAEEVRAYEELQSQLVAATADLEPRTLLELGVGTGETAKRVLARHPEAHLTGFDASTPMLEAAREVLPHADLREATLADPLPAGPFDLIYSALVLHHVDGPAKRDVIARAAAALAPGGRFVLADIVVLENPADAEIPLGDDETPSTASEHLDWMAAAGLEAVRTTWAARDLVVLAGEKPG